MSNAWPLNTSQQGKEIIPAPDYFIPIRTIVNLASDKLATLMIGYGGNGG